MTPPDIIYPCTIPPPEPLWWPLFIWGPWLFLVAMVLAWNEAL